MSGLSANANRITENVRECLKANGYECDENDCYIMPDQNYELVAIANAIKDGKIYKFELLLSNRYIVCKDENIELDMKPYKK